MGVGLEGVGVLGWVRVPPEYTLNPPLNRNTQRRGVFQWR